MLTQPRCTKGWGQRCRTARGPRSTCQCNCGGHNHGATYRPAPNTSTTNTSTTPPEVISLRRPGGLFTSVTYNGTDVPHVVRHSPTGMEWGYGGSGPADCALSVLSLFTTPATASRLHQDFKCEVIANVPYEGADITAASVRQWITAHGGKLC